METPEPRPRRSARPSIVRNVLSDYMGMGAGMVWTVLLTPFILRTLGSDQYGVWLLASSLIGQLGIVDLGFGLSTIRHVSRRLALGDSAGLRSVVSTLVAIYGALALVALTGGLLMSHYVGYFNVDSDHLEAAAALLLIMSLDMAIGFVMAPFSGVVMAMERYDLTNGLYVCALGLQGAAVVVLLPRYPTIVTLCLITVGGSAVCRVALVIWALARLPRPVFAWRGIRRQTLRELAGFTWWAFLIQVGERVSQRAESTIIGRLGAMADVTHFGVARRVVSLTIQVSGALARVMVPRASQYEARQEMEALRSALVKGSRACYATGLAFALPIGVYAPELLSKWLGPDFAPSGLYVRILLVPAVLFIANATGIHFLYGMSRHQIYAVAYVVSALAAFGLGALLMPRMGLVGIAWGSAIPTMVYCLLTLWLVCHYTGVPLTAFAVQVLLRPLVPLAPVALLAMWCRSHFGGQSLVLLAIQCFLVWTLALAASLLSFGRSAIREYWTAARRLA